MNESLIPNARAYAAQRQLQQFEDHWPTVEKVVAAFEELGIYLLDVSPANIAFD